MNQIKFYSFEGTKNMVIAATSMQQAIEYFMNEDIDGDIDDYEEIDGQFNMCVVVMKDEQLDEKLVIIDYNGEPEYDENENEKMITYRQMMDRPLDSLPFVASKEY